MEETACSTLAAVSNQVRFQESGLKIVPVDPLSVVQARRGGPWASDRRPARVGDACMRYSPTGPRLSELSWGPWTCTLLSIIRQGSISGKFGLGVF